MPLDSPKPAPAVPEVDPRDSIIAGLKSRVAEVESRNRETLLTAEVESAAGSFAFATPAAREMAIKLLRAEAIVDSDPQSGNKIVGPDMTPFGQYARTRLSSPDFQIFIRAPHQGGVGTNPGASAQPPAYGTPRPAEPPRNLGEAAIMGTHGLASRPNSPRFDKHVGIGGFKSRAEWHPDFRKAN